MDHAQYKQHTLINASNEAQYSPHETLPPDDIMQRMARLRAIASMQNKRVKSASKKQFSFAF